MRAERHVLRGGEAWMFSCRTRRQRSAWQCDEPAAVKDDGQLEQWIVDHWLDALPDFVARAREASPRLDELQADVARAQFAFEQWRDDIRVQERLGMDAYLEGIATRQDALNTSLAVLTRERARIGTTSIRLDIADVRARWTELTSVEQRDLLQSTIRCVFVRGSRSVAPLDGRLHIVWQGESIELPSRGSRSWSPRPFRFEE
jgi:hypothetical protein